MAPRFFDVCGCSDLADDYMWYEAKEKGDYELCFVNGKVDAIQSLRNEDVETNVRYEYASSPPCPTPPTLTLRLCCGIPPFPPRRYMLRSLFLPALPCWGLLRCTFPALLLMMLLPVLPVPL